MPFGAPLLKMDDPYMIPAAELEVGDNVWTVGPHGRRLMTVATVHRSYATLRDEEYEGEAVFDGCYFTQEQADQLGTKRGAWRLERVRHPDRSDWAEEWTYTWADNEWWLLKNTFWGLPQFDNSRMVEVEDPPQMPSQADKPSTRSGCSFYEGFCHGPGTCRWSGNPGKWPSRNIK
jgi:hypothetical protein